MSEITYGKRDVPMAQFEFASKNWLWIMIVGILFCLLGIVALSMPVAVSISAGLVVGIVLMVGGIAQLYHAFKYKAKAGFWFNLVLSILTIAMGILMWRHPLFSTIVLTITLISYFIAHGILKLVYALRMKPTKGWGFILASGVVSIGLGLLLLAQMPVSALYVLGVFVGVDLLFYGITEIALALEFHRQISHPV